MRLWVSGDATVAGSQEVLSPVLSWRGIGSSTANSDVTSDQN